MANTPRWLALAATGMMAVLITACTGATPTTAPTSARPSAAGPTAAGPTAAAPSATAAAPATATAAAPSTGATTAPESPSATGTAAAPTGEVYPAEGEVTCPTADGPGSFNGVEYVGKIKSINAPDPMTVVFNLCSGDGAFLPKLAFGVFAIGDADWYAENIPSGAALTTMNGTGALKLDEWRQGTEIDYSAFDGYWGDPALTATQVLKWAAEPVTRLNDLKSGATQGFALVGPGDFTKIADNSTLQLATPVNESGEAQNLNTLYIGMNHDDAPWSDPLVRQAIAVGIDRQRLVENFFEAGSELATHFTPCALQFGCTGEDWPDFNADTAKDLLSQAGFPDGFADEDPVPQRDPALSAQCTAARTGPAAAAG